LSEVVFKIKLISIIKYNQTEVWRRSHASKTTSDHRLHRDYPPVHPPTLREIAAGVGLKSSQTANYHLTTLVKLGLIERRAKCPRCIALVESRL